MSDYRVNFGNAVGPSDTNKLYDMLDILNNDDELIITVDANDTHQTDSIIKVLEGNNFSYSTKGSHSGDKYNIFARRRD